MSLRRKPGGWEELDDFHAAITEAGARALDMAWDASATGDLRLANKVIFATRYDIGEDEEIVGFKMTARPDDIIGDFYRAWIKVRKIRRSTRR